MVFHHIMKNIVVFVFFFGLRPAENKTRKYGHVFRPNSIFEKIW